MSLIAEKYGPHDTAEDVIAHLHECLDRAHVRICQLLAELNEKDRYIRELEQVKTS